LATIERFGAERKIEKVSTERLIPRKSLDSAAAREAFRRFLKNWLDEDWISKTDFEKQALGKKMHLSSSEPVIQED